MSNFFYGNESEQYSFFRVPRLLMTDSHYKTLSNDAKLLYGLLLDRMGLSRKNNWLDNENRVYIIYTIEQIQEEFNCSNKTAIKLLKELENFELILKKRQGQGRASIIYVLDFVATIPKVQECKKYTSKSEETTSLEVKKVHTSYTDNNYTNISNQSIQTKRLESFNPEVLEQSIDRLITQEIEKPIETIINQETIEQQISLDTLVEKYPQKKNQLHELSKIILNICNSNQKTVAVQGQVMPIQRAKKKFLEINGTGIEYLMYSIENSNTEIKNLNAYLITSLYNCMDTAHLWESQHAQPQTEASSQPSYNLDSVEKLLNSCSIWN